MPEHVVTFLLTEVVDSIRRWEHDEVAMTAATERLDAIVLRLVDAHAGTLVKPRGEGDSHFLVFGEPSDAVACAVALQRVVHEKTGLAIRSACHVGAAELRAGDWYGTTVNRCARLRAAAHAGQSLVSSDVAAALSAHDGLPNGISLRSLGRHRLKDLDEPAEVFQLRAPGLVDEHPALATMAQTHGLELPRSSFVGRTTECDRALAVLASGGVVTVSGPPGVGTTRFATETAAQWWKREGRPVRVIEHLTSGAIAAARVSPDDLLLVLDSDAGFDVGALNGPGIVTSHRPLGVAEETLLRLMPLDPYDAERLLMDRVAEDIRLPAGLARWCDGLPLAIELLARRASSVDGAVLAERVAADPLAVLGGDRRADPRRHVSMRAAFAAAFDALGRDEQADLLASAPGDPRWVAAGWHEADGPLPLIAAFLAEIAPRP